MRQILGLKSSNGLIRVLQKIVLQSSLKQNQGFPSQVRRLNFTGVLIVVYFRQTDLSGLCSVAFCLWTISLSLSPAKGNFVVETRLAKIHVCTSNENAYIVPGKASFVFKKGFRQLKIGSGTHEKEKRYAKDPRIHL